jgi:hypothetical protein
MPYDNTNRWTLNKNDRKEKETHPDYKGSLNVDGVDYWIDGWIKEGANGKFISGSLKPKNNASQLAQPRGVLPVANGGIDATSDSVPF